MIEERFRPYADVLLVLVKDRQVLLSKRRNTGYQDGNYGLVGGHLEGKETFKKGIIRELKEEAGIVIKEEDLKVIHLTHRFNETNREYFSTYLQAEKWSGEITNMEPDKCDELKWYKIDELPDNIIPEIKFALECIEKNIYLAEFGFSNLK